MQSITAITQVMSTPVQAASSGGGGIADGSQISPQTPFAGLLAGAVHSMNTLDRQAAVLTTGLIEGTGVSLPETMIATEKADAAFELALAVRNKAVSAYQQVMDLQF